ncbi:hypothetical protein ES708_21547 [subsurface metagenome]
MSIGLAGSTSLKVNHSGFSYLRAPLQAQESYREHYRLPLDDTHSLAFRQIGDFRFVQVITPEPIPELSSPLEPSDIPRFPLLGLIARAMRVGYYAVKGYPHPFAARTRYPARFFLPESQISNRVLSPFTAIRLLERTTMAARRAFHILTSLLVALREALSLSKRIG